MTAVESLINEKDTRIDELETSVADLEGKDKCRNELLERQKEMMKEIEVEMKEVVQAEKDKDSQIE